MSRRSTRSRAGAVHDVESGYDDDEEENGSLVKKRSVKGKKKKLDDDEDVASPKRRSKRLKSSPPKNKLDDEDENKKTVKKVATSRKKTTTKTARTKAKNARKTKMKGRKDHDDESVISKEEEKEMKGGASSKKNAKSTKGKGSKTETKTVTKKGGAKHQEITEREILPKLWDGDKAREEHGSYTFKIISWNVDGLRAVLKNHPDAFTDLVREHSPDILCLQETKLQEQHLDDPKLKIRNLLEDEGYDSYFSCSQTKKGYSGTAVFYKKRKKTKTDGEDGKEKKKQSSITGFFGCTKKKEKDKSDDENDNNPDIGTINTSDLIPLGLSSTINSKPEHDIEGRTNILFYPLFTLINVYVPNAGQKLERLSYRTEEWDVDFLSFIRKTEKKKNRHVPVIWMGDLNVAHQSLDVWNDGAKHLLKQPGTTVEERKGFDVQLNDGEFVDAFRWLHGEKKGQYTYWSQRAGNREPNKGLRLDYFVCSRSLFNGGEAAARTKGGDDETKVFVRDSYILADQQGSDHCPIVLELEIRNS